MFSSFPQEKSEWGGKNGRKCWKETLSSSISAFGLSQSESWNERELTHSENQVGCWKKASSTTSSSSKINNYCHCQYIKNSTCRAYLFHPLPSHKLTPQKKILPQFLRKFCFHSNLPFWCVVPGKKESPATESERVERPPQLFFFSKYSANLESMLEEANKAFKI